MELERKKLLGYALLVGLWGLLAGWQAHEHSRVRETAQTGLRNRSLDIADTLSALIRGMRFRGAIPQDRLEAVLNEMVTPRTNELTRPSELISIVLLNAQNEPVAAAGRALDLHGSEVMQKGERWGSETLTIINPVDLGLLLTERATNPTVVLPPITNAPRGDTMRPPGERGERMFDRERPPPPPEEPDTPTRQPPDDSFTSVRPAGSAEARRSSQGSGSSRRPPWLRSMSEADYQSLLKKRALHGLVLMLSTESVSTTSRQDLRTRLFIMLLATLAVAGIGMAWRNMSRTSDLQIRLVRASELNAHLKEMNLAAAGLAHETRNPLNIIRGLAHLISKEPAATPDLLQRSRDIISEVDKVAAQLNEFINYSRPREVHRVIVPLKTVFVEVTRALAYDIEEKRIQVTTRDEGIAISADEQLLRQALFNLLLNAIQAVEQGGSIDLAGRRMDSTEAAIEVRDNGPGVPADKRAEIFKPYFTTQKAGTGLGLAVCQQIVLAHGWEIECLSNEPRGAIFRMSHLKLS